MVQGSDDIDAQISKIVSAYSRSAISADVATEVAKLQQNPTAIYDARLESPSWAFQTGALTHRSFLNMLRNIGIFWLRAGMYVMLCIMIGFIYFQLNHSW